MVEAARLHRPSDRRRLGRTLIEGPHLLTEALSAGIRVERIFALEGEEWPDATPVTPEVIRKLAGTDNPRGPVAVIDVPIEAALPTDRSLLVLWAINDPGNVGTILRSAAAFGLAVAVGPATADPWAPKVLRAGAGAHFRMALGSVASLSELAGRRVAATVVAGGIRPDQLSPGPWAVLVGSEAHGLDDELVEAAETLVTIPMPGGSESLNAAVAASILAYELRGH